MTATTAARSTLVKELLVPAALLLFAGYLLVGILAMRIPEGTAFPGPRFFPGIIAALVAALSLLQIGIALRAHRAAEAAPEEEPADDPDPRFDRRSLLWVLGGFLGFVLLLDLLGWLLGAGALFWCVARAFGSRAVLRDAVVGLSVAAAAYIAFDMMLGLSLPSGLLGGL